MALTHGTTSWPAEGGDDGWGVIDIATSKLWVPAGVDLHTGGTDYWSLFVVPAIPSASGPQIVSLADGGTFTPGTSPVSPAGIEVDETSTAVLAEGKAGIPRGTTRREQFAAYDATILSLAVGALAPNDQHGIASDITHQDGTALVTGDFDIRDTANHYFRIPMAIAGWRTLWVQMNATFNQTVTWIVYGGMLSNNNDPVLTQATVPASNVTWVLASGTTAVGGMSTGAATIANQTLYSASLIQAPLSYVLMRFAAGTGPGSGTLTMSIGRSRM